ncbi:MAG: hypothetical protein ACRD02_11490, partial [Acidimicrobiia bacterium]
LDSGLSALWYSISSADNTSVPFISTDQQCGRLVYVSTTQIRLDPQDGNSIWVNTGSAWKRRLIPSAGITAANTNIRIDGTSGQNLVANTLYWVHLFDNAGTLTIDFSSGTAPAVDTTSGLKIKTGVASRALIGMVRTNASTPGQFQAGLVASWYKRRKVMGSAALTTDRTRSETSATELHSEIRVEFLSWSEEAVLASYVGYAYTNTVTASHTTSIYLNNLATLLSRTLAETPTANLSDNVSQVASFSVSEGHHYVTVAGHVGAGTGHWPAGTLFVVTER